MRHAAVAVVVALAVALSGCNVFGGGGSAGIERTVSPAAVPEASVPNTPESSAQRCLAPPAATPTPVNASAPADPVALPREGGTINGSALVELHASALADHRFRLRIEPRTEVRVMPNATAFSYEGIALDVGTTRAYAVAGTLYTLAETGGNGGGEVRAVRRPYGPDSERRARLARVLTGSEWLAEHVAPYNYTVVDRRTWNGVDVRVLRTALDRRGEFEGDPETNRAADARATLYVDRRGIVRLARIVDLYHYEVSSSSVPYHTEEQRFAVVAVGEANVLRPAAFCVEESRQAVLATPQENPGPYGVRVPYPRRTDDGRTPTATDHGRTPTASENESATPTTNATATSGASTPTAGASTPTATPEEHTPTPTR